MKVTKVEPMVLETPMKEPWRIGTAVYTSMHAALVRIETDEAERLVAQGYPGMKLKIGQGIEADVRNVREIRRAVGDGVQLMTDANCAYDTLTALQLGRRLEAEGVAWFEEPVAPHTGASSAVEVAASLQWAAALPNFLIFEYMYPPNPLREELLIEPLPPMRNGHAAVPQKPGLGIEIDEKALARFRAG